MVDRKLTDLAKQMAEAVPTYEWAETSEDEAEDEI